MIISNFKNKLRMKKNYLVIVMAVLMSSFSATVFAQAKASSVIKNAYLSSVQGSNLSTFDGQVRNVTMYRLVYNGWNTICLPFSLTEAQLNEFFGDACKLEALTAVSNVNDGILPQFNDVKADGIKANVPYLLYYSGENANIKMTANESLITFVKEPKVSFSDASGNTVEFCGAVNHVEPAGQYGIYVRDNADANFTQVQLGTSGFYATRCYINAPAGSKIFVSHNGQATGINNINAINADNGKVYNLNGGVQNGLQKGINVMKGKKVLVK